MSFLPLKVSEKMKDGKTFFEGTVAISGVKPTKLIKKSDQSTQFANRSGVLTTARNFAKKLGFEGINLNEGKKPIKKAMKKKARTTKSRTTAGSR